jgi:hypothetical protein
VWDIRFVNKPRSGTALVDLESGTKFRAEYSQVVEQFK